MRWMDLSHSQMHVAPYTYAGKCNCCSMDDIRNNLVSFARADICGVQFTAGQALDGGRSGRCGSLVTCVVEGQSIYGRVVRFFVLNCTSNRGRNAYAYIEWLNMPEYPMGGTPLVVKVRDNGVCCLATPVVSIFDIDPSRVINERCDSEYAYYMCRIEGLDIIKIINL